MDKEPYQERYVNEFNEDVGTYEQQLKSEVSATAENVSINDFYKHVMQLPRTYEYTNIEDTEAINAYRHVSKGELDELDLGQAISLYRVLNTIVEQTPAGPSDAETYAPLKQKVEELDYVISLEHMNMT